MKKILLILFAVILFSCKKELQTSDRVIEEIATSKAPTKICNPVCDVSKSPDLQIVTNLEESHPLRPDGSPIDSFTYYFTKYQIRTKPVRFVQNYVVTQFDLGYYPDWVVGDTINKGTLQCLIENIAPKGCSNDWLFWESQGKLVGTDYEFNGLFEFETYERGNGNKWSLVYVDHKKRFFPSYIPAYPYWYSTDFCYYFGIGERSIQAQMGDFYSNAFRFPNHDGLYKLVLKFNPASKNGCRVIKETNYTNNEKTVYIRISNGALTYSLTPNI
ncbi:MAG: hypothetical protein V4549_09320 [Bacteroidota bacterium]